MLNRILAVLHITLLDGIRRHTILGLFILGVLAEMSGLLYIDFFGRDIGRAASDYAFSIMWLIGLCFLFFHATHNMAWDEDRKNIYVMLSRPISRSEYVIGIFLGLALLLIIIQSLLGLSAFIALYLIKSSVLDIYFATLSLPAFFTAWLGLIIMQLCLLAVMLLLSAIFRGAILISMMSLAYYLISSSLPVIRSFMASSDNIALNTMFSILTFIFPNYSRLDYKDAIASASPLTVPYDQFFLAVLYCFFVLSITRLIYQHKDIY
ncbi:MAG: ABC transporter permease subunit [Mariprofundaceae bacterium]